MYLNVLFYDSVVVILKVAIHYYGRLAAKQGWRFDSTYDHKDDTGDPIPFVFLLGSPKVKFQYQYQCIGVPSICNFGALITR